MQAGTRGPGSTFSLSQHWSRGAIRKGLNGAQSSFLTSTSPFLILVDDAMAFQFSVDFFLLRSARRLERSAQFDSGPRTRKLLLLPAGHVSLVTEVVRARARGSGAGESLGGSPWSYRLQTSSILILLLARQSNQRHDSGNPIIPGTASSRSSSHFVPSSL